MTFFDPKEEVLDIELTPYGKHLLSKGVWKPEYYEFYDDDIVYDVGYFGISETQDATQERIKQVPRNKVQYTFEGAEERYKEYKEQFAKLKTLNIPILEKRKNFSLSSLPLANSSIDQEKNPTWNVNILRGKINNVASSFGVTGLPNNGNIINLDTIYYKTSVKTADINEIVPNTLTDIGTEGESDLNLLSPRYEDGTYINVESDYLFLDIKEDQVELLNENFDLFVYLLETDEKTGKEKEIQLYFEKEREMVINNLYIDDEESDTASGNNGQEFVGHYFNIFLDKDIGSGLFCTHLSKEEVEMLRVRDGYIIECEGDFSTLATTKEIDMALTQEDLNDFEDC